MMRINKNYTSSAKTLGVGHIHKVKHLISMHAKILGDDLSTLISLEFTPFNNHQEFYDIEADDQSLKKLLNFESYDYFDYEFDQALSRVMNNLFLTSKTYIEYAIVKDEGGNIVGLSLIPFDAIKMITLRGNTFFLSKDYNGKLLMFNISAQHYIELNAKGLGIKRNYFKKLVRKLKRMDKDRSAEFTTNEKMSKKFVFSSWVKRKDFLLLKHPRKIGWYGRHATNSLLSESYLFYRTIEFKLFRQKCLDYLLKQINLGLQTISDEIQANGKIVIKMPITDYEKEWQRYVNGEICASELSDIIYKMPS